MESAGGQPMTFLKPLNFIAICATFAFLGAIVFGVFGGAPTAPSVAQAELQAAAID
jgi:hypothetical protein